MCTDRSNAVAACLAGIALGLVGCASHEPETITLKHYPLNDLDQVVAQSGIALDSRITVDGKGALRIDAESPTVVRLFEAGDLDIEDAILVYQARLRTEGVEGQLYLEMLCSFPGRGQFFSRGLQHALTGSNGWTTTQTYFFLRQGENPDNVWLNLIFSGRGTAWVDDVRLIKTRQG
jgi:hypothetical protein